MFLNDSIVALFLLHDIGRNVLNFNSFVRKNLETADQTLADCVCKSWNNTNMLCLYFFSEDH